MFWKPVSFLFDQLSNPFNLFQLFFIPVQSKALAGAKSLGNFLYSAVNKAGKTVTEAGSKIHVINVSNVSSDV